MRKIPTVAVGLLLLMAGCIELEVGVTLEADGSGTQTLHLGVTDRIAQSIRASARALDASGTRADPLLVFDAAKVKKELADQGLVVTHHKSYREGPKQLVDVTAKFANVGQLEASTLFGAGGEWFVLQGRNKGGLRLVYYPRGHQAWKAGREKAKQIALQPTAVQKQFFETQKKKLRGLDIALRITLPGDVDYASKNLKVDGKRDVIATVKSSDIQTASDLVKALAPRYEVEFDGRLCKLKVDLADPGIPAPPKKTR